jgi:Ser/Thr protein kinase RdoA (MazF antagonist)
MTQKTGFLGPIMEQTPFPVQRSLLAEDALAERVLSRYSLPCIARCRFWKRGINDTYLVESGGDQYVLRIAPAHWRSREHVLAEMRLLRFLDQQGLTVPQPVEQREGTVVQILDAPEGPRHAVLFTFVPGSGLPPEPTEDQARRYGEAIARFHQLTDEYPADPDAWRFEPEDTIDHPLARLEPLFAGHEDDYEELLAWSSCLRELAKALPRTLPTYGLCHGDVNNSNFHVIDEERWALLDFEYLGYGPRIFDLATYTNNQLFATGQTPQTGRLVEAFLDGYASLRALSAAEREALPSFVVLRQLWLLGVGARNLPNIGHRLFEHWAFERVMPMLRRWVEAPWVWM